MIKSQRAWQQLRRSATQVGGYQYWRRTNTGAVEALPGEGVRAKMVAIGETTAAALRAKGFAVAAVAARPDAGAVVAALARAVSGT